MTDWTDTARAAGLADADIAAQQAYYASLPDESRRYQWLVAANSASVESWARLASGHREWIAAVAAPGGGATLVLDNVLPPVVATTGITATPDNRPSGPLVRYITAATSGLDAGILSPVGVLRRQWLPALYARIMTDPSAVTSSRLWVGLTSAELGGLSANPTAQHVAAFRYDSGLDGSAYWRAVTCDGTASTVTVTGAAVTADSSYELRIEVDPSGSPVRFWSNSLLVATHSTHLPGLTTDLAYTVRLRTLAAVARSLRFGRASWSQR